MEKAYFTFFLVPKFRWLDGCDESVKCFQQKGIRDPFSLERGIFHAFRRHNSSPFSHAHDYMTSCRCYEDKSFSGFSIVARAFLQCPLQDSPLAGISICRPCC